MKSENDWKRVLGKLRRLFRADPAALGVIENIIDDLQRVIDREAAALEKLRLEAEVRAKSGM